MHENDLQIPDSLVNSETGQLLKLSNLSQAFSIFLLDAAGGQKGEPLSFRVFFLINLN